MATYQQILRAIEESGADYAWMGLNAAGAYGSTLVSYDFDFFVRPEPEHLDKARAAFRALGMQESFPNVAAGNLIAGEVTTTFSDPYGGPLVDLMTKISGPSFDEVWRDHQYVEFAGLRVRTASLEHIIASKRAAGREKDLYAIKRLREELGGEVKEAPVRYRTRKRK
ncbi:MAG: hypothetical protein HZA91_05475 [Verrucomicrobia bacterium]|nr:hypothetical protein [Verrucomicrobiota bacterium]